MVGLFFVVEAFFGLDSLGHPNQPVRKAEISVQKAEISVQIGPVRMEFLPLDFFLKKALFLPRPSPVQPRQEWKG